MISIGFVGTNGLALPINAKACAGQRAVNRGVDVFHQELAALPEATAVSLDHIVSVYPRDTLHVRHDVYLDLLLRLLRIAYVAAAHDGKKHGCQCRCQFRRSLPCQVC